MSAHLELSTKVPLPNGWIASGPLPLRFASPNRMCFFEGTNLLSGGIKRETERNRPPLGGYRPKRRATPCQVGSTDRPSWIPLERDAVEPNKGQWLHFQCGSAKVTYSDLFFVYLGPKWSTPKKRLNSGNSDSEQSTALGALGLRNFRIAGVGVPTIERIRHFSPPSPSPSPPCH